jgi:hypothetical protein
MPPEIVEDEDYSSAEDEDFNPDAAPTNELSESEDEGQGDEQPAIKKRKRQAGDTEAEDAGFENSGDEAIIDKGNKRRKRSKGKDGGQAENEADEGGEGGFVKTRSMRATE